MDIKDFFYNGGVVKCVDHTESDVVIEMCKENGLHVSERHNPQGEYHGACLIDREITFWKNGSYEWAHGTPFEEWLVLVAAPKVDVEDLI